MDKLREIIFEEEDRTFQECPECHSIEKGNRKGELFNCLQCGFAADDDHVGALNILSRFTEEFIVP